MKLFFLDILMVNLNLNSNLTKLNKIDQRINVLYIPLTIAFFENLIFFMEFFEEIIIL